MKVAERLKKIAASTGLITCSDSTSIPETNVMQTRTLSLTELQQEFDRTHKQQSGALSAELAVDFDRLFEAMKVPALSHGWNAKSVATYLQSNDILKLNRQETKQTLLRVLQENKVPLEDILMDAVNRDNALDAYEQFAHGKLQERTTKRQAEIAALEREIAQCNERIQLTEKLQSQDEEAYQVWLRKKIAQEEDLVNVVSMITSENKISVGSVNSGTKKGTK